MKVAISAGHYPAAPGAAYNGIVEHPAAVCWVAVLKVAFEQYGLDVFEVPTGKLPAKVGAINAEKCAVAVEIHFNSDPGHAGRGCETLYMPGSIEGEKLAREVQAQLALVCPPSRGAKEAWYRMDRPGHEDFAGDKDGDEVVDAFVKLTHCPSVIVEPLFIHEAGVYPPNAAAVMAIARGVAFYVNPQ